MYIESKLSGISIHWNLITFIFRSSLNVLKRSELQARKYNQYENLMGQFSNKN